MSQISCCVLKKYIFGDWTEKQPLNLTASVRCGRVSDLMVILHKDSSQYFFVEITRWFFSFVDLLNMKAVDHNCKIVTHCSDSIFFFLNGTNKDSGIYVTYLSNWLTYKRRYILHTNKAGNVFEVLLKGKRDSKWHSDSVFRCNRAHGDVMTKCTRVKSYRGFPSNFTNRWIFLSF